MPAERHITNLIRAGNSPIQLLIPSTTDGGNLAIGASSARVDITDTFIVRVATDEDCYLNFGDDTVVAAAGDVLHAAGVETYAVPNGATHMAYIQSSAAGTMNWRNVAPGETIAAVPGGALSAPGVTGTIAHNETITIDALPTENFGTKPDPYGRGNDKPLLVWRAEDNSLTPNSVLGNATQWEAAAVLEGDWDSGVKAVNSPRSRRNSLGYDNRQGYNYRFELSTDWEHAYIFVRALLNFDDDTGRHYRTRISSGDLANIPIGSWGRSRTAPNATGKVEGKTAEAVHDVVHWVPTEGSVSYLNEFEDFGPGSVATTIDIYATQAEAESGVGTILETIVENEGSPTPFRAMNNKQNRFGKGSAGQIHNLYYSIDNSGSQGASLENLSDPNYGQNAWVNNNTTIPSMGYQANEWFTSEVRVKMGTLDTADGIYGIYRNGILAFASTDKMFTLRESPDHDLSFDLIVQHGDDLGLGSGTAAYTDYYYVDDSWCAVIIADRSDLGLDDTTNVDPKQHQPCPIVSWADQRVVCVLQQGEHGTLLGKTVFVVDATGTVVAERLIS